MNFLYIVPPIQGVGRSAIEVCMLKIIDQLIKCGHTVDRPAAIPKLTQKYAKLRAYSQTYAQTVFNTKTLIHPQNHYFMLDWTDYDSLIQNIRKSGKSYDAIISTSHPFFHHFIAKKLQQKLHIPKWYAILWDPFVFSSSCTATKVRKKVASRVLNKASRVLALEGIISNNKKNNFNPKYQTAAIEIFLPSLERNSLPLRETPTHSTTLTFAGAFYQDIRTPNAMLDIVSKFPKDYTLKLYSRNCEETIQNMKSIFNTAVLEPYSLIPHAECMQVLQNSNILINVGNTISHQLPSKVFEYIASGKPVINFYSIENDSSLKYFKKYPLAYNFNTTQYTQKDIDDLINWCRLNKDKQLSFEEATVNLVEFRSDNVCKNIIDIIT